MQAGGSRRVGLATPLPAAGLDADAHRVRVRGAEPAVDAGRAGGAEGGADRGSLAQGAHPGQGTFARQGANARQGTFASQGANPRQRTDTGEGTHPGQGCHAQGFHARARGDPRDDGHPDRRRRRRDDGRARAHPGLRGPQVTARGHLQEDRREGDDGERPGGALRFLPGSPDG